MQDNIPVNVAKDLICDRWLKDDLLAAFCDIINTQSVSSFAIFYSHAFIDGCVTIDVQKKFHEKMQLIALKILS